MEALSTQHITKSFSGRVIIEDISIRLMENETKRGKAYPLAFAALSGALFILFYPALSGIRVDSRLASQLLGWLPTWPF